MRRAQLTRIAELPLDYVPNAEFKRADADRTILAPLPEPEYAVRKARRPSELPAYLASLYEIALLTREQEVHLFRKYNYLKFKASQLRRQLDPVRPRSVLMGQIERLYRQAIAVKNGLVQANLRLVVSIAKRYARDDDSLFNRISDGNISLMRAVEKFDYAQGNKFSTYASWAIKNNFARDYANDMRRQDRFRTSQVEVLAGTEEHRSDPFVDQRVQQHFQAEVGKVLGYLDDRERRIISRRFGLIAGNEPQTLQDVGDELGVSKERVRQLERRALDKLRAAAVQEKIDVSEL